MRRSALPDRHDPPPTAGAGRKLLREPFGHRIRRHRLREDVALPDFTAKGSHSRQDIDILYSFGRSGEVEAFRHSENAVHDLAALGILPDRLDEAPVDLDLVELQLAQVIEAR